MSDLGAGISAWGGPVAESHPLSITNVRSNRRFLLVAIRRLVVFSVLGATLAFILSLQDPPPHAVRIANATQPYVFNLASWQLRGLAGETGPLLGDFFGRGPQDDAASPENLATVNRYFSLTDDISWLQSKVRWEVAQPGDQPLAQDTAQLASLNKGKDDLQPKIQSLIERQIGDVLAGEGLATGLPFAPGSRAVFPPVSFRFEDMPNVLIVSPRDRIEVVDSVMLKPNLTTAEAEEVERSISSMGLAGLVIPIGGLATYPSMIPESYTLTDTLEVVAHEWMHAYFFFQPLGRSYWGSYEARSINETAADLVGAEIASRLAKLYPQSTEHQQRQIYPDPNAKKPDPGVDFNKEMRNVRLTVDQMLQQGKTAEAEAFMNERQRFFADHGFNVRKLNQAYFAFYGSYAEGAAVVSPLPGKLKALRAKEPSLGDYIKAVGRITSFRELDQVLGEPSP